MIRYSDSRLNEITRNYLAGSEINITELLESMLLKLVQDNKNNLDYLIQYVLVLVHEPIMNYEKAFKMVAEAKDVRMMLIKCYISVWYYNSPIEINEKTIKFFKTKGNSVQELSSLFYYASLYETDRIEKINLLLLSLKVYKFNFQSIINLKKLIKHSSSLDIDLYFENCSTLIKRLNKYPYLNKSLCFKPFLYDRILGLNRTEENINEIKKWLFN